MHPLERYKIIKSRMRKEIGQHQHRKRKKEGKQTREFYEKKSGVDLQPLGDLKIAQTSKPSVHPSWNKPLDIKPFVKPEGWWHELSDEYDYSNVNIY